MSGFIAVHYKKSITHIQGLIYDSFDFLFVHGESLGTRQCSCYLLVLHKQYSLWSKIRPFIPDSFELRRFTSFCHTLISVQCDKIGGNPLKVTQFHFTSWPDHGVPEYAGPILNYLCRMKAQMKVSRGPTLVHCRSAMVGNVVLLRVSALKVVCCLEDFCIKMTR